MKSGSTPMKVIHISAIFAQARVYSRSFKVQHVCWTLPFKIARQMFRSFCEPLRLYWRSCVKLIWMTNTTRMKTFYDSHAWVKTIRPICIRSLSIADCELYPYRGFAMNKSTLWHFGLWQLVERHFLQWIHIANHLKLTKPWQRIWHHREGPLWIAIWCYIQRFHGDSNPKYNVFCSMIWSPYVDRAFTTKLSRWSARIRVLITYGHNGINLIHIKHCYYWMFI